MMKGHEVWRAHEGQGSVFHSVATEHQLYWTTDDRLIFPWEATGWDHLYSISTSGGTPTELTPGNFEVEHVALSVDEFEARRRHGWFALSWQSHGISYGIGCEIDLAILQMIFDAA